MNPEYDAANPTAQPKLICLRPEALYSSDETDMSLGQPLKKGKKDICVFLDALDDGNIATTKTSRKISWQYGRCGDGSMLSPLIVYGGIKDSSGIKLEWIDSSIVGHISDESGVPIPTLWRANEEGSVTTAFFHEYCLEIIIPSAYANGIRDEDGKRGIYIVDCRQTHLSSLETNDALKQAGIFLIGRVPHTSCESQGEDTCVFRYVFEST